MRSVLLVLVLVLAGCARAPQPDATKTEDCRLEPALCDPGTYFASHHCIANDVRPRVYAPDTPGPDSPKDPWQRGDYWTYRVQAEGRSFSSTLVYFLDADGGEHYLVGSASADEALDHALFSINPMLGRIHRALYSPHESGVHADMFHFPICDGSTWTTGFYDREFQMRAAPATLQLPGGPDPLGFRISGMSSDGSQLRVDYSPAAKWFSALQVERADGLTVTMTLEAFGSGKSGRFYFLRAQQDEQLAIADVGAGGAVVAREDGDEGPYETIGLWIDLQRSAGTGKVEVLVRDPGGQVVACTGLAGSGVGGALSAGCQPGGQLKLQVPYAPGDWRVTVEKSLLDPSLQATGEVRFVSIYDRSGNV